jgi:thiol:disulfide interchange protein DsbD
MPMPSWTWQATGVVQWSAKLASTQPLKPGDKAFATLDVEIESGWHMYSISQPPGGPTTTVISVPPKQVLQAAGTITGPVPQTVYDPNFKMDTEFYEEAASFKVPLVVDSKTKPGPAKVVIDVFFQVCNDRTCMLATTVHVPLKVMIAAAPAKESAKPSATGTGANPPTTEPTSGSTVSKKSIRQATASEPGIKESGVRSYDRS